MMIKPLLWRLGFEFANIRKAFENDADTIVYFAYGGNLDPKTLQRRRIKPLAEEPFTLRGYRLLFCRPGPFKGMGFASIEPDPTAIVVGKLYTITKADILRLDFYELAPVMSHYYREQLTQDGKEFHVYRSTIVRDGLRPSPGYLKMILDGYGTMKDVPADYLGMLNATEALKELVPSDELEFVLRVEPWMPEPLKDVVVAVDRKCLVLFMKYLYARSVTEGLIRA
jgi:gamma-glutamylcyclotransferase (GGCT)/AIG2-like uncharacterized protein YtfP